VGYLISSSTNARARNQAHFISIQYSSSPGQEGALASLPGSPAAVEEAPSCVERPYSCSSSHSWSLDSSSSRHNQGCRSHWQYSRRRQIHPRLCRHTWYRQYGHVLGAREERGSAVRADLPKSRLVKSQDVAVAVALGQRHGKNEMPYADEEVQLRVLAPRKGSFHGGLAKSARCWSGSYRASSGSAIVEATWSAGMSSRCRQKRWSRGHDAAPLRNARGTPVERRGSRSKQPRFRPLPP